MLQQVSAWQRPVRSVRMALANSQVKVASSIIASPCTMLMHVARLVGLLLSVAEVLSTGFDTSSLLQLLPVSPH